MHPRPAVDRYLAEGLGTKAEARLRAHLRTCEPCRRYYDEQSLLYRALAGSPLRATPAETDRAARLAVAGAGLPTPVQRRRSAVVDALLWSPRPAWALAAAVLVVIVAGGRLARMQGAPSSLGAAALSGRVIAADNGRVDGKSAAAGLALLAGQSIEVPPGGAMEIAVERGGRVRLFPGTTVTLSPRGEIVDLASGKVWCEVDHTGGVFAVRTDMGEARVLGTSFVVDRQGEGTTEVRVMSGAVEVEDAHRRGRVVVQGGQKTRVARDRPPAAVTRYSSDEDRLAWEKLFREIERGIRKGVKALEDALKPK